MNLLFFLLLLLGFTIYYELRILKIIRKYEPDEADKTDLYKRLQPKEKIFKEKQEKLKKKQDKLKENFKSQDLNVSKNCDYDSLGGQCMYDDILKINVCKKEKNGYYSNVDESCCAEDCSKKPVQFTLNKNVANHPNRSADVANLGSCNNYNTPTKNGELQYAGFYYCYDDTKMQCVKKPRHFEMWKNTCGNSTMTSGPLPVFDRQKECLEYRADIRCFNPDGSEKTEKQCLETSYCGWCNEGNAGKGKCVPGTPIGPNDITLKCFPNVVSKNFSYKYGNTNPFILDPSLGIA